MTPYREWSLKIEQAEDLEDLDACMKGIAEDHELADTSRQRLRMACDLRKHSLRHAHAALSPPPAETTPPATPAGWSRTPGTDVEKPAGPFSASDPSIRHDPASSPASGSGSQVTPMNETKQDGDGGNALVVTTTGPRGSALARLGAEAIAVSMENAAFLAEKMIPNMVPEYHYGNPKDKYGKAAWDSNRLLEPGASLIRNAFGVVAKPIRMDRTESEDGHYQREVTVGIYPIGEPDVLLATGSGSASTHETKYAYRWVKEDQIPPELDKATLKHRGGKDWEQFRVPNEDLGDMDNTVLKMALKRAEIDGTYQLAGCSEIARLINPEKYPQKTPAQMSEIAKKAAPAVFK